MPRINTVCPHIDILSSSERKNRKAQITTIFKGRATKLKADFSQQQKMSILGSAKKTQITNKRNNNKKLTKQEMLYTQSFKIHYTMFTGI